MFFWADPEWVLLNYAAGSIYALLIYVIHRTFISRNPNEEPDALLFHSAQFGSIAGMEKAIKKDPKIIYASDIFESRSALHLAAASPNPAAVNGVRWLLDKGIPWCALDMGKCIPEDLVKMSGNEESCKILREWAINKGEVIHIRSGRELNPYRIRAAL